MILFPKVYLTSSLDAAIHGAGDQITQPRPSQVGLNPVGNGGQLVTEKM